MRSRLDDHDHHQNFELSERVDRDLAREPQSHRRPRRNPEMQRLRSLAIGWRPAGGQS